MVNILYRIVAECLYALERGINQHVTSQCGETSSHARDRRRGKARTQYMRLKGQFSNSRLCVSAAFDLCVRKIWTSKVFFNAL